MLRSQFFIRLTNRKGEKILNSILISNSRFIFKNNGVLFENDLIQIGVKSEYRQNLGRLGLFYGNKTQTVLQVSAKKIFFLIFILFRFVVCLSFQIGK